MQPILGFRAFFVIFDNTLLDTGRSYREVLEKEVRNDMRERRIGNVIRILSMKKFEGMLGKLGDVKTIAIVGGGVGDPEVDLIHKNFPLSIFSFYGIDPIDIYLDLNQCTRMQKGHDLVICVNVVEHIFNHENFSLNLANLLNPGGFAWCVFPFSDQYHGAPEFYSSGFHPKYVALLLRRAGLIPVESDLISSPRLYLFVHLLKDWPSEFRFLHPFIGQVLWGLGLLNNSRPPIRNLAPRKLLYSLLISLTSKKVKNDPDYGISSYVLAQKPKGA